MDTLTKVVVWGAVAYLVINAISNKNKSHSPAVITDGVTPIEGIKTSK